MENSKKLKYTTKLLVGLELNQLEKKDSELLEFLDFLLKKGFVCKEKYYYKFTEEFKQKVKGDICQLD